jgi:hypothetical protein
LGGAGNANSVTLPRPLLLRPEGALGAHLAIERQLRRLIIGPVASKAILLVRAAHTATLNATRNDGEALGLHTLSLRHPDLLSRTHVIYSAGEESPEKKTSS